MNASPLRRSGFTKVADVIALGVQPPRPPNYYTTSETVFMVATPKSSGTGYEYNVYTGYANAPASSMHNELLREGLLLRSE